MADSTTAVMSATPSSTRLMSPRSRARDSAWAISRVRSPSRREISSATSEASVVIPKPPICTRAAMTTWPKGDQYVAVSTVVRPTTQTAEVAVKNAVSSGCPILADARHGQQEQQRAYEDEQPEERRQRNGRPLEPAQLQASLDAPAQPGAGLVRGHPAPSRPPAGRPVSRPARANLR